MPDRTVIVASQRQELVVALSEAGFGVMGPVTTASMALTLAAQAPAALALIDEELTGRRNGPELAAQLFETWGVRSVVLGSPPASPAPPWAAGETEAGTLRALLEG